MSSTSTDAKKRCKNCLEYVKIYITCFKCDAAYHIYCWKKVPGAYVNKRGQLFCCSNLTSNYATTNTNLGTQDNPPERVIEKGNVDDCKEVLENHPLKQEDSEWNEFVMHNDELLKCDVCHLEFANKEYLENHYSECGSKEGEFIESLKEDKDLKNCLHTEEDLGWSEFRCDACLLELINKEHLINHYNECPNKEGEFIQQLKENKARLFCSFCNEEHFQKESYEQHIKQCRGESSCSRLNKDNSISIINIKRNPVQIDEEETYKHSACNSIPTKSEHSTAAKKYKCKDCEYCTHVKVHLIMHIRTHTNEKPFKRDMCDYAAAQREALKRHVLTKHSNAAKKYV